MITKEFITAGRAVFTVENPTGEHYTFQVAKKESPGRDPIYFAYLLTGPDNTSDYTYLGVFDVRSGDVRLTAKSRMNEESTPVRVIRWVSSIVWRGRSLPEGYAARHEGRCGRCGRVLTTPESISLGLGPHCANAI